MDALKSENNVLKSRVKTLELKLAPIVIPEPTELGAQSSISFTPRNTTSTSYFNTLEKSTASDVMTTPANTKYSSLGRSFLSNSKRNIDDYKLSSISDVPIISEMQTHR